ncbi:MAG TPA: 2'-5' RNA ligase family protein [Candidatus Cryosericum sp.]|nr:2'-5' RNA ligase family protein [Candidatus Cryosericum sp.]
MDQEELRLRKGGAVTVPVAGTAATYVDTFRRRYDPHVDLIMPHITLAFAAELDACDWMPARSRIQAALADVPPFDAQVRVVDAFPDNLVLWLRPDDPDGQFVKLRNCIMDTFPGVEFDHAGNFVAHISIGFFETPAELEAARTFVAQELVPFTFHVSYLSFLQADEGNVWRCVDTVELGTGTAHACHAQDSDQEER